MAARPGDTITLAVGSQDGMNASNTTVTFTSDSDNIPVDLTPNIRAIFNRRGGSLGTSGSVGYMFETKGVFTVPKGDLDPEEFELEIIDAGVEDIEMEDDMFVITTALEDFGNVQKKLEEMRKTVDEKLHDTLEKRLGESFKLVSDRLEAVHKGLGEMQNLATGVGDLKRVLTNVKARGTWGEVQLGAILEQILTPEQYEKNVKVKKSSLERVEYAIRLPGPKDDPETCVWLPIDSKFPQEDYLRLQEASEQADPGAVQSAADALARTISSAAKDIHDKYINPPGTTDFGIMFLATEGLYAEILRQPTVVENLQNQYRIVIAGPTTLAAILNSLRMGFQTLAIEQRSAEVWKVLAAVKTEFGKFGDVIDRVKRQLDTASRTIDQTGVRSRAMERRLRSVERMPEAEASKILVLPSVEDDEEGEEDES